MVQTSHLGFTDPGRQLLLAQVRFLKPYLLSLVLPASLRSSCPQVCLTALVGDSEAFCQTLFQEWAVEVGTARLWSPESPIMEQIMGLGRVVASVFYSPAPQGVQELLLIFSVRS